MSEGKPAARELPFVADWSDGGGRCYWHVEPSGDYARDCDTGTEYAFAYLRHCQVGGLTRLQQIVAAMPHGRFSGVEVGFLSTIGCVAAWGADAAEQRVQRFAPDSHP